ncbi:hypothetical protein O3W52_26195 [Ensifer psoraleae]|uniref:Uncharacterized protein n=1 Tax=Sinorhizobium psoraleae TaxID=520838 RepID=A0ABT4KN21_9HYPH|nr:hypothetical protein [Sinorhizobium psoraleae]
MNGRRSKHRISNDLDDPFAAPTAEERRVAAARVRNSVLELEALLAPLIEIERETGGADVDAGPGIGHNKPPGPIEDAGFPPGFLLSLGVDAETIANAVARTEDLLEGATTAPDVDDGAKPDDSNTVLARAMSYHAEALQENTKVVRANSELLRENSRKLHSLKKAGLLTAAGAAIGTVFNGALTKIGELLVEKGMALLEPLGPSALAYFDLVVTKIAQVVEAASGYVGTLPLPF